MVRRSRPRRHWALAAALAALLQARCGARSALTLPEPCAEAESQRRCSNTCGEGERICQRGYWQPCVVPTASRSCSNTCGPGEQSCVDDAWLPCSVPVATRGCSTACAAGTETCSDDAWGACSAAVPGPPTLSSTVRNIILNQPDFFTGCCTGGLDPGIVASTLGADGTPVYAGNPITGTPTTHGAADFADWYHDVPGINLKTSLSLPLTPQQGAQPATNVFDNEAFFPIDGQLFGNQGADHNFNFTLESHAQILYLGGETYGFSSDDDLWVFLNHHLVVDLGGLHAGTSRSIDLDLVASAAGLVTGQTFPLDLFYANREPPGAVLMVSVPQSDLWGCPSPPPP